MITEIYEKISQKAPAMNVAERAIVQQLSTEPIMQRTLAKSEPWIGAHPKHEGFIAVGVGTTLRMVRSIIRDLRIKHGIPILYSVKGYYLPDSQEVIGECLKRMEGEVKARNAASFETYKALKDSCGALSEYFEKHAAEYEKKDADKAEDVVDEKPPNGQQQLL